MTGIAGKSRRSATRITKTTAEALATPAKGGRSVLWDAEVKGFGVRVTSSGVRTYVLRYKMTGNKAPQRQVTIGRHGSPWTADQARRRALELLVMVRGGIDPAQEVERADEARVEERERRTARMFDVLAQRWFDRHVVAGGLRSQRDVRGVLDRDLKPAFAGLTVDEITKVKVAETLEELGARSRHAANKAHKWLRQMFNWFVEKGVVDNSPLDRMKKPFPDSKRKRVLSLLEIVLVWIASEKMPGPFGPFYRLLVLLGQRLRETSNLPWSEIDLEAAEWLLPGARAKNKRDHAVPLSVQAVKVIEAVKGDRKSVHGPVLTTDGKVGISGFSKMKEALDEETGRLLAKHDDAAAIVGMALADWVVHDLRRSLATGCQAMSVPMEVTEAVLNHVAGREDGVRGVYQLYDYYDEKADALDRWGALVEKAVAAFGTSGAAAVLVLDPTRRSRRRKGRSPDSVPQDTTG